MKKNFLITITLLFIFTLSIFLRVNFSKDTVFSDPIKYAADDGIYHMRLIENELLGGNFPSRIDFDPYTYFPYGTYIHFAPLYDQLLASFIWIVSLGEPTQQIIDSIAPFYPPVLGSLLIFIAYFCAKKLWSWKEGLISALLVCFSVPYLFKSLIGVTDHHFAEVLFSSLAMMFVIYAFKEKKESKKFWIYSALAGLSLGLYFLTWVGAVLFLFIIFLAFALYFLILYLSKKDPPYWILKMGGLIFIISFLMILPFFNVHPDLATSTLYSLKHIVSFALGFLGFVVLFFSAKYLEKREKSPWILPSSGFLILSLALIALYFFIPQMFDSLVESVKGINLGMVPLKNAREVIAEMTPLTFNTALSYFSYSFYAIFLALGFLIYKFVKKRKPEIFLVIVWSIVILLMTGLISLIGQNRFVVYLGFLVPLLLSFFIVKGVKFGWKGIKKARNLPKDFALKKYLLLGSSLIIFNVIFIVTFPFPLNITQSFPDNLPDSLKVFYLNAKVGPHTKDEDMYEAMEWLKNNTPQLSVDYYKQYSGPKFNEEENRVEAFEYGEDDYGIICNWDIGHMITYYAHRIPISNPFQQGIGDTGGDNIGEATFYLETDEDKAVEYAKTLKARYILTDFNISMSSSFIGIVQAAGADVEEYLDTEENEGEISMYDNSMVVRLHRMDGTQTETAEEIIPALSHFRLVWESKTLAGENENENIKLVKIFEYVKGATIKGKSDSEEVIISTNVLTNQNRTFVYKNSVKTEEDGTFEITVPYSTDKEYMDNQTEYWVFANPYKLDTGSEEIEINVSEEDIIKGNTIEI